MKMLLFITFTIIGLSTAAQLTNTYLPPASASTAGGHGGFLQGPSPVSHSHHQPSGGGGLPSNQYIPPKTTFNPQGQPVQWSHGGWNSGGAGGQQSSWQGGHGGGGGSPAGHRYSGSAQSSVSGYSHGSGGIPSYRPQKPQVPILRLENENDGLGNYHFDYQTGDGTSHQQQGHVNNPNTDWAENVVQGQYSYTGDDGKQYTVSYKADGNGFQAIGDHLPTPPPQPREIQEVWNRVLSQQAAAGGGDWSQGGSGSGGSYYGGSSGGRPYQGAGSGGHHSGAGGHYGGSGSGSYPGSGSGTSWQQQQSYGGGGGVSGGKPHHGNSGGFGGGPSGGFGGPSGHHGGGGGTGGGFGGARPQKPENQYLPPHSSGSTGADGYHY